MASEMVPVTREQLAAALASIDAVIEPAIELFTRDGTQIHSFRYPVKDPDKAAEELFAYIEAEFRKTLQQPPVVLPSPPDWRPLEDPELIAAQQILDALAPLEVLDPAAVLRVLRWARERYDL